MEICRIFGGSLAGKAVSCFKLTDDPIKGSAGGAFLLI